MDEAFLQAVSQVFGRADVWLIVVGAAIYGVFVGAIPGLTATMAVAVLSPFTFFLEPSIGLPFLLAVY